MEIMNSDCNFFLNNTIEYIKIEKKNGELIRNILIEQNLINNNYKIQKVENYLQVPIKCFVSSYFKKSLINFLKNKLGSNILFEIKVCNDCFYFIKNNPTNKISDILGYIPKYEIIGDIAIINKEEKNIQKVGFCLLNYYKSSINTVLHSLGPVYGEFRIRKFEYVCGVNKKETLYKENGCIYHIDLENAYFTQHLATERKNIVNLIHENDIVIDMFCGVGPYSILIAKNVNVKKIVSVDKNPTAILLLKKNISINKIKNIEVVEMDAKDIKNIYSNIADHVIMNLPQNSIEFIESAIISCKKNGFIHYYSMTTENKNSIFKESIDKIKQKAFLLNKNIKIIDTRIIRSYAPHQYNIRIDIQIIN